MKPRIGTWLSAKEAGDFAGVSAPTIVRWGKTIGLPMHRIPGTFHWRINPKDLVAFLQQHNMPVSVELMVLAY